MTESDETTENRDDLSATGAKRWGLPQILAARFWATAGLSNWAVDLGIWARDAAAPAIHTLAA